MQEVIAEVLSKPLDLIEGLMPYDLVTSVLGAGADAVPWASATRWR
ncbi:MAG: hypothetical protein AB1Z98_15045 [Nannocystaceae bacterium]